MRYSAGDCTFGQKNYGNTYIGTDIGFNVLVRPVMYDSYHEVAIIKKNGGSISEGEDCY